MTQIENLNGSKLLNIFNRNIQRTVHSHGKNNLESNHTLHTELIPDGCHTLMRKVKSFKYLEDIYMT